MTTRVRPRSVSDILAGPGPRKNGKMTKFCFRTGRKPTGYGVGWMACWCAAGEKNFDLEAKEDDVVLDFTRPTQVPQGG